MAARLAVFLLRYRRFGHERSNPCVFLFVGQLREVFLGHAKVITKRTQLLSDPAKLALYLGIRPR